MGQDLCTGRRCKSESNITTKLFHDADVYREKKKNSPYYRRQIRKTERRLASTKMQYELYKENKYRKRLNSN